MKRLIINGSSDRKYVVSIPNLITNNEFKFDTKQEALDSAQQKWEQLNQYVEVFDPKGQIIWTSNDESNFEDTDDFKVLSIHDVVLEDGEQIHISKLKDNNTGEILYAVAEDGSSDEWIYDRFDIYDMYGVDVDDL